MTRYKVHRVNNTTLGLYKGKRQVMAGSESDILTLRRALDAMRKASK